MTLISLLVNMKKDKANIVPDNLHRFKRSRQDYYKPQKAGYAKYTGRRYNL